MNAEIIAVGNEVISGHTINTNASYIARAIEDIGFMMIRHTAIGDCQTDIESVLEEALKRSDFIFVIGGLGPTDDDLTKEVICQAIGQPLIRYECVVEHIKSYFDSSGRTTPENNYKQAYFPKECTLLDNSYGTAPGCILSVENKQIILLPGPPRELIPMVDDKVLPYLRKWQKESCYTIDVQLFGLGESHIAEKIPHLLGSSQTLIVAPYVGKNEVIIRIKSIHDDAKRAKEEAERMKVNITECLGEYIIGYNGSKLEETIMALLAEKNYTIATAESCTGGLVASTLINCSGISSFLAESIVTYSNEAKIKYLGVQEETLSRYGAVSRQVAKEMAEGIKRNAKSKIGLATTGIAGPDGGSVEKPVGLVYLGIALPRETYTYELRLDGTRQEIREKAVRHILYELYKQLV